MDVRSGDISTLIFKRIVKGDQGEVALSSQMLQVLMELDGKKNLADISNSSNINMVDLRKIVTKLYQLKLIVRIDNTISVVDKVFFDFLGDQLSKAMGPIAQILIDDEIEDMGLTRAKLPRSRAAELVSSLARQIPREEKRVLFQQAMLKKLKEINP